jgi:hypothetical protein
MKKVYLLVLVASLISSASTAQTGCIELFISEYVEGWGNNKALEIYNPTGEAKDLSNYRLERYSNGSPNPANNQILPLEGTIDAYSTYVVVIDKRDPLGEGNEQPVWDDLQAKADTFCSPVYSENNVMYFNGNDAIVFRNISNGGNGFVIDVIGRVGEDPQGSSEFVEGWNDVPPTFTWQQGVESWTKDKSLIRKFNVELGDLEALDPFDPSVQWDSIPEVILNEEGILVGNWESLGSHDCSCNPLSADNEEQIEAKVFPNPLNGSSFVWMTSQVNVDRVAIFDITGKEIKAEIIPGVKEFQIDLSVFEKGIYIIQATSGERSFSRKILKN